MSTRRPYLAEFRKAALPYARHMLWDTFCTSAVVISWLAALTVLGIAQSQTPLPRSILVLDQSGPGLLNPGYAKVFETLRSTLLAKAASPITLYLEKLDLDHFNEERQVVSLTNHLTEKYSRIPIGVVVAIGSSALEFALRLRPMLESRIPIVVVAADEETVTRVLQTTSAGNVTGRTLQFSLKSSIGAARLLIPNLQNMALVGDPWDQQTFRHHFRKEFQEAPSELRLIDLTGLPMTELRKRVSTLPSDTAILYTTITSDGAGVTYLPNEALEAFADAAERPIVVDVDNRIGHGATGGFVVVPPMMGQEAAELVLRLFNGEEASQIPVANSAASGLVFDWRQLRRWGISDTQLPPGSEIRFRASSIFEQYQEQAFAFIGVLLFQALLIAWLIYEHQQRNHAEMIARTAMSEVSHSNRIAMAGELSGSIAHEVSQPLTGIVMRANAALRWLSGEAPDIDKARVALSEIVSAGHRAGDIVTNIRSMFKKDGAEQTSVDINKLIRAVLAIARIDLERHQVTVYDQLGDRLPPVLGNAVQLQQVVLNLIMNAVESMNYVTSRILRIKSELEKPGHVHVSIEDLAPASIRVM